MDDQKATPELKRQAILKLNPIVCPVRIYDAIDQAYLTATVMAILDHAEHRGWTR